MVGTPRVSSSRCLGFALAVAWLLAAFGARAEDVGWSYGHHSVKADLAAGRPLVVEIIVPLCDKTQIACGSGGLGSPGNLRTNLYWGALYGAKRYFDRPDSGFEGVELQRSSRPGHPWLERAVYRRWVAGAPWGLGSRKIEQIVVLYAVHGASIDLAVDHFWARATSSRTSCFRDGHRQRRERIHVVGYAGHNRLMDGKRLPAPPAHTERAIPSFVLACLSDRFFSARLRAAGSLPLVTTRAYIAPEGYALTAAARALGRNASPKELRDSVVRAYARAHELSFGAASRLFAPAVSPRPAPPREVSGRR